jgi:hypothetical protein
VLISKLFLIYFDLILISLLLSFALMPKKVTKKRSRLHKNFWFSTVRLNRRDASRSKPIPAPATASLARPAALSLP